jgi:hypothetical protein
VDSSLRSCATQLLLGKHSGHEGTELIKLTLAMLPKLLYYLLKFEIINYLLKFEIIKFEE